MTDRWFVQSSAKYFFWKVLPFFKQLLQQLVCHVLFCLKYSCFVQYLHMVTTGWKMIVVMANKLQLRYLWGRASKIPSGVRVWLRFIERLVITGDSNLSPPTLVLHLNCVVWNHPTALPSGGCNVATTSLCDFCKRKNFFSNHCNLSAISTNHHYDAVFRQNSKVVHNLQRLVIETSSLTGGTDGLGN